MFALFESLPKFIPAWKRMKKSLPLAVTNADGRPSVSPEEQAVIASVFPRVLPLLREEARKVIETDGFTSARTKVGQPMVRVAAGWCVFFNAGCVLHTVGAEDGDSYQYKPTQCALFPLEKGKSEWYIRQWGYDGEDWDLFCLNPANSPRIAVESLAAEMVLAARLETDPPPASV
jgi:hypothetical protein